ncbi:hypothetical protein CDD83_5820 [Cordyceps sp. RAO-2017]|nr:hypothetical protein CDD83_5820 [Cordyceps sp. RAO-2017]
MSPQPRLQAADGTTFWLYPGFRPSSLEFPSFAVLCWSREKPQCYEHRYNRGASSKFQGGGFRSRVWIHAHTNTWVPYDQALLCIRMYLWDFQRLTHKARRSVDDPGSPRDWAAALGVAPARRRLLLSSPWTEPETDGARSSLSRRTNVILFFPPASGAHVGSQRRPARRSVGGDGTRGRGIICWSLPYESTGCHPRPGWHCEDANPACENGGERGNVEKGVWVLLSAVCDANAYEEKPQQLDTV